jgi:hypothetical protein
MFALPDAMKICEKALTEAQDKIEEMNEDDFKESKSLLELHKENLSNWQKKTEAAKAESKLASGNNSAL